MNTLTKLTFAGLLAATFTATTTLASAEETATKSGSTAQEGANSGSADANTNAMTDGEIKKVDKSAGKLTIRHSELKNLGMPAMTMVFKVKDAAMLDSVKSGDKVNFVAEKVGSQFTVVKLEPKK
jgi:Cu(I)/Ag(I) efflux system periplasmic protein CusF